MISTETDFVLILKTSQSDSVLPLQVGNNSIMSNFFQYSSQEGIILFNLCILNKNEAFLRTFDYFPLIIHYINEVTNLAESSQAKEKRVLIRKQTIININSILNIQIFPFCASNDGNSSGFFYFEKLTDNKKFLFPELWKEQEVNFQENLQVEEENISPIDKVRESEINNEENLLISSIEDQVDHFESKNEIVSEPQQIIEKIVEEDIEKGKNSQLHQKNLNLAESQNSYIVFDTHQHKSNNILSDLSLEFEEKQSLQAYTDATLSLAIVFPRKTLIIEDEVKDEIKDEANLLTNPAPNSKLLDIKNQTSKIFTRSSKSLETQSVELLERKRKRQRLSAKCIRICEQTVNSQNNFFVNANVKNNEQTNLKCTICLDPINNISRLDKCEHEFCKECIDQWAILSSECPLCKIEFSKIIYWEDDSKHVKNVKKRKFKYEEEEEEPWYQNCAEKCMVCEQSNDEHLLLVCDKCSYNICHTYCAGLDFIPNEEWLCAQCLKPAKKSVQKALTITNTTSNVLTRRNSTKVDENVLDIKLKRTTSKLSSSSLKNINIPISCNLKKSERKGNSVNLNVNVNLQFTNQSIVHKKKLKKSLRGPSDRIQLNQKRNSGITRKRYELRRKK